MRAILIVSVFVFPLPGPARTTQWPVELYAAHWAGLRRRDSAACKYSAGSDTIPHEADGVADVGERRFAVHAGGKALREPALANGIDHRKKGLVVEAIGIGLPTIDQGASRRAKTVLAQRRDHEVAKIVVAEQIDFQRVVVREDAVVGRQRTTLVVVVIIQARDDGRRHLAVLVP